MPTLRRSTTSDSWRAFAALHFASGSSDEEKTKNDVRSLFGLPNIELLAVAPFDRTKPDEYSTSTPFLKGWKRTRWRR